MNNLPPVDACCPIRARVLHPRGTTTTVDPDLGAKSGDLDYFTPDSYTPLLLTKTEGQLVVPGMNIASIFAQKRLLR